MKTADLLFENRRYDVSLFFCHLALEKLLKGLIVKRNKKPAPYIHDLAELANSAKIKISDEEIRDFGTISTFNIAGRYDSIKLQFHKRCTKQYAREQMARARNIYLWLGKEYRKK
ncbi:HEPN domain-containing protein [Candidatus Uhrbacteria bacterium]|nr:HEPN domain-containing protein [Candidatus Uhrbacteria bacterium]